ncbi:MAG: hypothetical protein LBI96_07770, partial [Odoribacteraceae bacterium]|nr:hypothetical protein [Odoribacteraceae bacterium]
PRPVIVRFTWPKVRKANDHATAGHLFPRRGELPARPGTTNTMTPRHAVAKTWASTSSATGVVIGECCRGE